MQIIQGALYGGLADVGAFLHDFLLGDGAKRIADQLADAIRLGKAGSCQCVHAAGKIAVRGCNHAQHVANKGQIAVGSVMPVRRAFHQRFVIGSLGLFLSLIHILPVAAKRYQEQLDEEIEADRAAHGKKPLKKDDGDDGFSAPGKQKMVTESTTDPESGVFHKGEHKKCFAYEAHTVCDRRGYILETEITPGNVHDSVAFDTVFERLKAHYPEVQVVTADAGYKTPWICKQIFDSGKIPSLPYKRPMTKKGNLPWYAYVYDEYYDCILCPQDKVLSYATTNREGYREYKSKSYICRDCPELEKCTQNRQYTKTVTRHIWQEYLERAEDIRHSPVGKATYALRSQTIERVFADAKEKHAMRYTPYRGLAAVTAWVKLKFAAMNLKKLALHKWRPFLLFYLHLLLEATSLRCNVASLTG